MTYTIIEAYIIITSIIAFTAMFCDKRRAVKNKWRIKEITLITLSLIGGGMGGYLGMRIFHHKTKHRKFQILLPLSAVLWLAVLIYLIYLQIF